MMPTKLHEQTREVPVEEAGANGAMSRDELRAAILGASDIRTEDVHVPEWGVTLTVRGMTGSARDAMEARYSDAQGNLDRERMGDFRAAYVAHAIVDAQGRRVFGDEDIKALGEKSSTALQRLFEVAVRLSALDPASVDGLVDDLKGDPNGATGSD